MNGRNRCKILKDIRRSIAEENGIEYVTSECKYKGDCAGTCPKCEAEVRYLERELERRRSLGYKVTVAGLVAGITLTSSGCTDRLKSMLDEFEDYGTMGAVGPDYGVVDNTDENDLSDICEMPDDSSLPDEVELQGDIAFSESDE